MQRFHFPDVDFSPKNDILQVSKSAHNPIFPKRCAIDFMLQLSWKVQQVYFHSF